MGVIQQTFTLHQKINKSNTKHPHIIEVFKVTLVVYFIANFNLLSCELDNFTFKLYIESFYINNILKQKKLTILPQFLVKNLKWFLPLLLQ